MGGKGGKAPPPPDYGPIAAANKEAAEMARQTAQEQLAWAKEQYAQDRAFTEKITNRYLETVESESAAAAADRKRYQEVFQPVEDRLLREANEYASPQRMEYEAGRAQADVSQAFEAQRRSALANLESYGVDPSMARSGALDRAARTTQAAASAGAANTSRLQTEAVGRALRGEAINLGRGYQSQIAQAYQTANQAGNSAVSSNLATTASGANTMGTALGWAGQQGQVLGNWGANTMSGANAARAQQGSQGASTGAMIGGIAGIAGAVLAPFTGGASLAVGAAVAGATSGMGKSGGMK